MELSSLKEGRENGGVDTKLSSLTNASVDHLVALIDASGRGSSMVKAHIQEACNRGPTPWHVLGRCFYILIRFFLLVFSRYSIKRDSLNNLKFILVARDHCQAVVSQKDTLVKVFSSLGVPNWRDYSLV